MTTNVPPGGAEPPIYNGRYELRNQIARGGTAQVYLARDLLLDRPVALKVLFPELSTDSSFVERFRREAQAAANLSHPNIVPVFDWGESDRTYFIVMEHVDGEPLSAIIRNQAPLPPMRAAAITADIAKALSYAHRHGVVHRDVKPGNVLITRDGQVKVADFGIARAVDSDDNVTQTGLVMGTATYFSPEQAQGLGVDGRSDVYSLGVVLYEMVTGRAPFLADTPVAIAYKHVSEPPVLPRELEPTLPVALEAIIMRAMAKSPADRYATAEDFHADLQRFMQGAPVLAPLVGGQATQAMALAGAPTALQTPLGATAAMGGVGAALAEGALASSYSTTGQQVVENGRGPTDPGAPVMPKRRWIPWAVAGILLVAALVPLALYGAHQLGYLGGKGYFYVPAVQGRKLPAAERVLKNDGLVPKPKSIKNAAAAGTVLYTDPRRGAQVQRGDQVLVYYSAGPGSVSVPDVVGENFHTAEAAIRAKGLTPLLQTVSPHLGQGTLNTVEKTNPPPNTAVKPHSSVTIYYYSGAVITTVPPTHGLTVQAATTLLNNKGLQVAATTVQQLSSTVKKGLVIGSQPGAGATEPISTPVTLIVSEGAGIPLPNEKGQKASVVQPQLQHLGLNVLLDNVPSSQADKGLVISQTPSPGLVAPNTTVTLTVGEGHVVTVTSPGSQSSAMGSSVNLQIQASDAPSSGAALTYSASGLPPGLTINSSTGVISGTVAPPPQTYSVTVTVKDSTGATGTVTFTWTVTAH